MWDGFGPLSLFLIFIISLVWIYIAGRLWFRAQINSYKDETNHRNQIQEESKDGKQKS